MNFASGVQGNMKKILLVLFTLAGGLALAQKTKADSILGKWKYMGAMKSQPAYRIDTSLYKNEGPTPKFEFIEFKKKGACTYNEKGKALVSTAYKVNKNLLLLEGVEYEIRSVNQKNLILFRDRYVMKDEHGKTVRIDEEQLHFTRQ
jgi:hypothetical protein